MGLRIDPFSYGKDSESHLNWKPEKKRWKDKKKKKYLPEGWKVL
jgi:hypothetical protein